MVNDLIVVAVTSIIAWSSCGEAVVTVVIFWWRTVTHVVEERKDEDHEQWTDKLEEGGDKVHLANDQ